jgi:hypothetical protein
MNIRPASLLALLVLASCTAQTRLGSREIFDEQSASTLLVVGKPLVFARERSDVAAHARDYVTLVAVEEDRSGNYNQYLLQYRWSTVDRRMSQPPGPDAGAMHLLVDGRPTDLLPLASMPIGLTQRRSFHVPAHSDAVPRAYRVDTATLHFIADSRELSVRLPQDTLDMPFTLWDDGRAALKQFLQGTVAP